MARQSQFPVSRKWTAASCLLWVLVLAAVVHVRCQAADTATATSAPATNAVILEIEGTVEVVRSGQAVWSKAAPKTTVFPGDRLRVGARSRAVLQLTPQSTLRLGEYSVLEVPGAETRDSGLSLKRGLLYFFHRDKPTTLPIRTPALTAVVRGTEFAVEVAEDGQTRLSVIDGQVDVAAGTDRLSLASRDEALVRVGQASVKSTVVTPVAPIQWVLYYPVVLNPEDLGLDLQAIPTLKPSLDAYRAGNPASALAAYPNGRVPASSPESLYLASLLLSVGQVEQAGTLLNAVSAGDSSATHAAALRRLIRTIEGLKTEEVSTPVTATGWMVESYVEQSRRNLSAARDAAERASALAPAFAAAWSRLAELEFSFGRTAQAVAANERALSLAPDEAQALTLQGFLLTARGRIVEARIRFERAITVDGSFGNAWLGRGLCKIREGRGEAGRQDLLVACTLEPQRALFRSYLAKAYALTRDTAHAGKELLLAQQLDPADPTAWLYSAVLREQQNRINEGISDLQHSQSLNRNRAVYRSQLLLDQDQSMRGANLARLYRDAGMPEVALEESVRAVQLDYGNASAHLFAANSYDSLRDRRQINLRWENAWFSEYLTANLLSPAGAGVFSPAISHQEYSRLLEQRHAGYAFSSEYLSHGSWSLGAAAFGTFDTSSYSIEGSFDRDAGWGAGDTFQQLSASIELKQQLGPQDSIYLQSIRYDSRSGDVSPYYDPALAVAGLSVKESQDPGILAGYHHEWGPGSHSLLLAGWMNDSLEVVNPQMGTLVVDRSLSPTGDVTDVIPVTLQQRYRSAFEFATVEAQQIWQTTIHQLVIGGRYQSGHLSSTDHLEGDPLGFGWTDDQSTRNQFERRSGYGYYQIRPLEPLSLQAGVSYDWMDAPENSRYAPLSANGARADQWSPKFGFVWEPVTGTVLRGGFARSLTGLGLDQSARIEPVHVGGFDQAFRGFIPEAVAGANAAAPLEQRELALEQKFGSGTFITVTASRLSSDLTRRFGVVDWLPGFGDANTRERLNYRERSIALSLHQLVAAEWAFGAGYRLSRSELDQAYVDLPAGIAGFRQAQSLASDLQQAYVSIHFNHASGFFGEVLGTWIRQSNRGFLPDQPGDDLWQMNLFGGYRFARRQAEVGVGVLNVTGQDYRLSPLTPYSRIPRDRTFALRVRAWF